MAKSIRKIAVVGCGAVGSYYGARLASSGHEVHFLLRSDYDAVAHNGVRILSPHGDFSVRPVAARHPAEIGSCDVVLVAMKTTANHVLPELVPPLLGPTTALITLQNGLGNEEILARLSSPSQVFGGLCFVCLNRIAPGVIRHIAHGQVVLGEYMPRGDSLLESLAEDFRRAGIPCRTSDCLAKARWEKLIWNIPFNGLGVAGAAGFDALMAGAAPNGAAYPCLTSDQLISEERWERLVRGLMLEVISAAGACGHSLSTDLVEEKIGLTRSMGPYKASTLLDFENRQPIELATMFLEPCRRAKEHGAKVPLLEKLCGVLRDLENWNQTFAESE